MNLKRKRAAASALLICMATILLPTVSFASEAPAESGGLWEEAGSPHDGRPVGETQGKKDPESVISSYREQSDNTEPGCADTVRQITVVPTLTWDEAFGDPDGNGNRKIRGLTADRAENPDPLGTGAFLYDPDSQDMDGVHRLVFSTAGNGAGPASVRFDPERAGVVSFDYKFTDMGGDGEFSVYRGSDREIFRRLTDSCGWTHLEIPVSGAGDPVEIGLSDCAGGRAAISNLQFLTQRTSLRFAVEGNGSVSGIEAGPGRYYTGARMGLSATPEEGSVFAGWFDQSGKLLSIVPSYDFSVSEDVTSLTARFVPALDSAALIGDRTYGSLTQALQEAQSGDTVLLLEDAWLDEDATVGSGVTLVLPCGESDRGYDPRTGSSPDGEATSPSTGASGSRYRRLTVPGGVTLSVEGTVLVNAVTGRPASGHYDMDVNGGWAEIGLEGELRVKSGGLLDVFGYVRGGGTVTVESGGEARDLFVVRNWRGGGQAFAMYPTVYPMNQSDMRNIEVRTVVESGGTLSGNVKMFASGSFYYTVFPQVDSENGLIRPGPDGTVTKTLVSGVGGAREKLVLEGGGSVASGSMDIVGMPLSTDGFVYPIDGDTDIEFASGEWTVLERFKIMPGGNVTVRNAASVTVERTTSGEGLPNELAVYDMSFTDPQNTDNTQYPTQERGDAVLTLEGNTSTVLNGSFGGTVRVAANASETRPAVIRFDRVSVTTQEANGYYEKNPDNEIVDYTFTASLDGFRVGPGSTCVCWKEGGVTVIKTGEDGSAKKTAAYGDEAKWADDGGVYEYRPAGGRWGSGTGKVGAYSVRRVTENGGGYKTVEYLGTLTVEKRTVEVALDRDTFVYDGTQKSVTASVANRVGGDDVTVTLSGRTGTDAGSYTAKVTGLSGAAAGNYRLGDSVDLPWTITRAPAPEILFPTASGPVTYDPYLTLSSVALVGGSTRYGVFEWTSPDTVPTVNVNEYSVTFKPDREAVRNYEGMTETAGTVSLTVNRGSQSAPVNVTAHSPESADARGWISGVTADMEYRRQDESAWKTVSGDVIADLEPGTYQVRYRANDNQNESPAAEVTVDPFVSGRETAPSVEIDFRQEKLTGFADGKYTVNGAEFDVTGGALSIAPEWIGGTVSIIRKGTAPGRADSTAQRLAIPARPAAPTGLTGGYTSAPGAADGTVKGFTGAGCEYAAGGAWKPLVSGVTPLAAGVYRVRFAATDTAFYSAETSVEVRDPTVERTPEISIDYQAEKLNGFGDGIYTVNGERASVTDGRADIDSAWFGASVEIVRKAAAPGSIDSKPQILAIPARPTAPRVTVRRVSGDGKSDGGFTVTDPAAGSCEYRGADGGQWKDMGGASVENLPGGIYYVRVKAGNRSFVSLTVTVDLSYSATPAPGGPGTTETVTNPDGSTTTMTTDLDGTVTETTTRPDGSVTVRGVTPEGVTGQMEIDADGGVRSVEVTVPGNDEVRRKDVVTAPVEIPAARDAGSAPEIRVRTETDENVRLEIPVTEFGPGTVALIVREDGAEEVVRDCVIGGKGVVLNVKGSVRLKIVDNSRTFADGETVGSWARDAVDFVAARRLFDGNERHEFKPKDDMTRGMLVTVLHRLAYDPQKGAADFADVLPGAWYYGPVAWAQSEGVVKGYDDGLFHPDDVITREQLVSVLYRYAQMKGYSTLTSGGLTAFSDAGTVHDYARDAMDWAVTAGLVNGVGADRLDPAGTATREQVAAIFMRFCEKIVR